MNKVEYAIYFATKAHQGQKRKIEDIDMIFHPFIVGMMLQKAGCDDDVICAGILHDVVEDTKYTFDDIEKEFGEKIKNYVYDASEKNKSLEWEERKKYTIKHIKNSPLESKLIVACDKISNLDDLYECLQKYGEKAWNSFKRGKEKQKWYYENVYESLIYNQDQNHPLFKRYRELLNKIFK